MIVLCSIKGFAQYSEYGGTYYDTQFGQTGVTVIYNPGPNWAAINAAQDAKAKAQQEQMQQNIPKQTPTPPITTGGITGGGSTPPKPTAPTPKPNIDPCAEIKKALGNAQFKAVMTELESPAALNKHNETGYWQDNKGEYHPMEINGSRGVKMPADMSTMENLNHVHMNNWVDPVTGDPVDSYPMPSPADIAKVYALGYNSLSNGLNLANTYVGNTSYLGSFQMRFVGNPDSLSAVNFVKIYDTIMSEENGKAYESAMNKNKGIEGLLAFLRDTLKTTDIAVYKIEATGSSKVELGTNNQITKTPCN